MDPFRSARDYPVVHRWWMWWLAPLVCACGSRSPWDPAVVEGAYDVPAPESAPFEIATILGDLSERGLVDALGHPLGAIGDFDGDGLADIATAMRYEEVFVAFGGARPPSGASELRAGTQGVLIVPEVHPGNGIEGIAGPGDFNGDGHDDLLIGIADVDVEPLDFHNRAYVLFGGTRPTAPVYLTDIAAGRGGVMLEDFGVWATTAVGDVDGDGLGDIALSGPEAVTVGDGRIAHVILGRPGTEPIRRSTFREGDDGFVIEAVSPGLWLHRVEDCGDVDADGRHDVLVSAFLDLPDGRVQRYAFVVFGIEARERARLTDHELEEDMAVLVGATADQDHFLGDFPACGDFDGDGHTDVVVSEAPIDEVVVALDVARGDRIALDDVGFDVRGARVRPVADASTFGLATTPVGDLDGDGRIDLLIRMQTFDGETQTNWALFVLGRDREGIIEAADVIGGEGGFGYAEVRVDGATSIFSHAAGAGDFDGNGRLDVVVSDLVYREPGVNGRVRLLLFDERVGGS